MWWGYRPCWFLIIVSWRNELFWIDVDWENRLEWFKWYQGSFKIQLMRKYYVVARRYIQLLRNTILKRCTVKASQSVANPGNLMEIWRSMLYYGPIELWSSVSNLTRCVRPQSPEKHAFGEKIVCTWAYSCANTLPWWRRWFLATFPYNLANF